MCAPATKLSFRIRLEPAVIVVQIWQAPPLQDAPWGEAGSITQTIAVADGSRQGRRYTSSTPHMRAKVDPCVQPAAFLVSLTHHTVTRNLEARVIAHPPGVDGNPAKGAVIARGNLDCVANDPGVLTAEEDDPDVRRVDDRIAGDSVTGASDGHPIRPAAAGFVGVGLTCSQGREHGHRRCLR